MLNTSSMPEGLTVRPARPSDEPFLQGLYHSARPDLQWIDGEHELIDHVIALQYRVQQEGSGANYPNAMHFVIEKTSDSIGAMIADFGHNEVRLIYLAFTPLARGRGYGKAVLQGVQQAARKVFSPVAVVVWRNNPQAKQLYLQMGFRVEESHPMAERLAWYPDQAPPRTDRLS